MPLDSAPTADDVFAAMFSYHPRDPLHPTQSHRLNSHQRTRTSAPSEELTQGSTISGLTSLENDTDEFGQFMIQQARDEKRLRSAINSNVPIQPFRKARKQQSLSLTFQNLERSNSDSKYELGYGANREAGSPASINGSDMSDPPLRLPTTWGRKGRVNRDWIKTIAAPQDATGELGQERWGHDTASRSKRSSLGPARDSRRSSLSPNLETSFAKRLSVSPTPRSYSPVARVSSPSPRSSSPFPRSGTPVSRIPQPSPKPATPTPSASRIPRLAKSNSALHEIAALELESDLSLNSVITSTPAPSSRLLQSIRSERVKLEQAKKDLDEEHCSTIINTVLGPEVDSSDSTRDTLRALSRILTPRKSPPEEQAQAKAHHDTKSKPSAPVTERTDTILEGAIDSAEEQTRANGKVEEDPDMEIRASFDIKQESPKRKAVARFVESPRRQSQPSNQTHNKSLSVPSLAASSAREATSNPANLRKRSTTDSETRIKPRDPAPDKSPTKLARVVTRPELPKSALEALLSRAKSTEETLEPLGDSTIDSLEDFFTMKRSGSGQDDLEDDTLAGIQVANNPPKNDNERKRFHEVDQLVAMNTRLRATRANLRQSSQGLRKFEHQVNSKSQETVPFNPNSSTSSTSSVNSIMAADGTLHTCPSTTREILIINPFLLLWAAFIRLFFYIDPATSKKHMTWFGLATFSFLGWLVLEWSACNTFCRPRYAVRMQGYGIDLYAPEFPFVIPTLVWRFLGLGPDEEEGRF
ncbi:hypothetical protein EJ05DRAFT_254164 [Pseudovirgaria hyperparasitica]|uniref:Uncharacterized protein n=1 Tax=Pseudovirgaria hyperparasitica TaxID=470096 RepID=A0A6A6WF29_9PEZI|nr:uncharacterized protein EJ05DRAFT_254164 [Pseudovirgaria hyperparasitica]KAF2761145.1 hypothetical protein EJ05DRAFT_254164 [Pseudovirgaria hyperparasitica]